MIEHIGIIFRKEVTDNMRDRRTLNGGTAMADRLYHGLVFGTRGLALGDELLRLLWPRLFSILM